MHKRIKLCVYVLDCGALRGVGSLKNRLIYAFWVLVERREMKMK